MPVITAIENAFVHIEEAVSNLPRVSATKIGLDVRAGYVYVDVDDRAIIVEGSASSIDYYGGFEYIEKSHVTEIGPYKIYAEEDADGDMSERLVDALDYYEENEDGD